MKSVQTGAAGAVEVIQLPSPEPGPRDAIMRVRACGICGTDAAFVDAGGAPSATGDLASIHLGHEAAGEIVVVGADVEGLAVGDAVVVNPMDAPSGLIGCGGQLGGMREYLLIENAVLGRSVAVIPNDVPFAVAALNEPMAVAKHCVNRSGAQPSDKVVVFGAGPIGLGATIWLKLLGVEHVVVVDLLPERLEKALAVGADAVLDSSKEDITARLIELHGQSANALGQPRAGTDIYIDAAGAAAVLATTQGSAKWGAKLVVVAVHQKPVDLSGILRSELTIIASMGYPTEIFEVTPDLVANWPRFAKLISHEVPFADVHEAYKLATTPGAADKVVVTFAD